MKTTACVTGQMSCHGVRLRELANSDACSMQLRFELVAKSAIGRE